jgi:carbon monoxide dehydrogenase subunit G
MRMTGEQRIEAPRAKVWAALNDPEVLKACIPGCQSLEKVDDHHMRATAVVKVGPITARFNGEVTLSDLDPPNGYRIDGEGQGGAAGFAKGGASVRLRDDGGATVLDYEVDAQVGGKLSQLGGGLIDVTAKQMANAFFKRLAQTVAAPEVEAAAAATSAAAVPADRPAATVAAPPAPAPASGGLVAPTAALAGVLIGWLAASGAGGALSHLAGGLVVVIAAWAAFAFGRRFPQTGLAPVVVLDPSLLARLTGAASETESST